MVEPHCKTGHGDRNNNYLLVSTVVIVPNSVCVFLANLFWPSVCCWSVDCCPGIHWDSARYKVTFFSLQADLQV